MHPLEVFLWSTELIRECLSRLVYWAMLKDSLVVIRNLLAFEGKFSVKG